MSDHGQRESKRPVVTLCCEYMVGLPLWDDEGAADESTFPLSKRLLSELRTWQEHWDTWFDQERGWRGGQHIHDAEGKRLLKAVRRELKSKYDVVLIL